MSKLPTSRLPVTPAKTGTAAKSGLRPPQQPSTNANASQQVSPSAAGDAAANSNLSVGDRVLANGKQGTIGFIGPTKFAEGEWIGVILDEAQGKNDGSYEGTRYFETDANRGLFCRAAKVQRLAQNGANNNETPAVATSNVDTPAVNTNEQQQQPPTPASTSNELQVGDRVVVSGTKFGTLKYLGKIHVADGIWCGIQLDDALGKNDGSVSGKRYFTCQQRYGLFSPVGRVEKVTDEMTQSQIIARKASISSSTNTKSQLHRSTSQESLHSNLSEFSTSSNSISRIPTRTPGKVQQQKLVNNSNLYTTPNTKSLLTQAAATLAAVTPSSNQLNTLIHTIKEKDIMIEKLHSQSEQDRLEFSRAAQQVDEMENRMLVIKQQLDVKEAENEQLKKEQYQVQQRLEDLEFQLEEYKLTDTNKEHSTATITTTIPDGHRLLTPKDIEIYEEIKQKVLELETTNQKLVLEKQTLQDEHRQELKRSNELIENNFQARINELEHKLTDTSKIQEIEQLKSQITDLQTKGHTQTTEKDTQLEQLRSQFDLLQKEKETKEKLADQLANELKNYQENLLPELEKKYQTLQTELTDLRNQDQTANLALNERETQFQQQLQNYQTNLNQAIENSEKVRNELKQIQEENLSKEQQLNDVINQLKQDHEKVQTELNQQEQKSKSTVSEYEQKVKDLQTKFEQTQSEFNKLQEEKSSSEKQLNDTINSLKQDYTRVKNELQDRDLTQNMALNEREVHYENQIKDYQNKQDGQLQQIQQLQNDLTKLQEEKQKNEKQVNELMNQLKQDHEKVQTELNQQEQKSKATISEYEQQIKDLQAKFEQTQSEFNKLQDEKSSSEKQLTETINSLKENQEKIQSDVNNLEQKSKSTVSEYEQQIKDLQTKLEQGQVEKSSSEKQLNETINSLKQNYETQLQSLQTKLSELEHQNQTKSTEFSEKDQQIQDLQSKFDRLSQENTQLQTQFNDKVNQLEVLQTKITELQSECQKQLTSNENIVNEKQSIIDQLNKQNQDMQLVESELIEKQIKQHANFEEEKKLLEDKIQDYQQQVQALKHEFIAEKENLQLAHEQEKLILKKQTNSSNESNGNVKQLEYELAEARIQIAKLQRQLENNENKDDRSTLESQINFLNDVIVELRNKNEKLVQDIEFLKNPFVHENDEEFSSKLTATVKSSAPRLYCDMCEVFDQHDTDDCPKQSSLADDQPLADHQTRERVLPPPRAYCEKCEEFGHDCNDNDETY